MLSRTESELLHIVQMWPFVHYHRFSIWHVYNCSNVWRKMFVLKWKSILQYKDLVISWWIVRNKDIFPISDCFYDVCVVRTMLLQYLILKYLIILRISEDRLSRNICIYTSLQNLLKVLLHHHFYCTYDITWFHFNVYIWNKDYSKRISNIAFHFSQNISITNKKVVHW